MRARGRYERGRRVGPWSYWKYDELGPATPDDALSGIYADDVRVGPRTPEER